MAAKKTASRSRKSTRTSKTTAKSTRSKERRPVAKRITTKSSIDIDRVVREEVTEWFTSTRKGLETVFSRVVDQVRDDLDVHWQERLEEERERKELEVRRLAEDNAGLRERVRNLEEEIKRMRGVLNMVRSQVAEDAGMD